MRRFRFPTVLSLVALALAMLAGVSSTIPAGAQEATPAAGSSEFPLEADPALCTVEPRATEDLLAIWFPEEGSPVAEAALADEPPTEATIPLGAPVDDEAIIAGVTATVHEVFSCFEAGDFQRATALFTDDLASQFGPGPEETREDVVAFLEATPVTAADDEGTQILAITDVMLLDDGRVGAFAVDEVGTAYVIFEQAGDRWLVDEVVEFSTSEE